MAYIDLLLNLALLVALSVLSGFIDRRWPHWKKRGAFLQGLLFGLASITGMLRPLVMAPGLIFDGRSVMISLCAFFFGPLSGLVAASLALVCRVWLGGIGMIMGVLVISESFAVGALAHRRYRIDENLPSTKMLYLFGLLVHAIMVVCMFSLPGQAKWDSLRNVAPLVMAFYPLATILAGRVLADQKRMDLDIVMLKQARDELRLFKESVDSSTDAVGMATPEGRHFYQNTAFTRLFGQIGDDPLSTVYVDPQQGREVFSTIMAGQAWNGEVNMRDAHGEIRPISLRAYASKDEQGRISGLVGIHTDISAQKQAEKERDLLQAQLLQAQKMESIGRLAGGVAHDFNNMLGVILGHVELALLQSDPSRALHGHLNDISKAAHRSIALTRQLLAFARKQTALPKVFDLNETIQGMLSMLQRLIGENIALTWSPSSGPLVVRLDPSQLDQILANLAVNARDAIKDSGQLRIETALYTVGEEPDVIYPELSPGEYALLMVADNGCGMDEQSMAHLYEPFYTTKGVGKGTGLGLATTYGIVQQNGGLIRISSRVGQGTEVKVFLPLVHGELVADTVEKPSAEIRGGMETVLLVEDEPTILEMGCLMLEQLGYRVLSSAGPRQALDISARYGEKIDVLLTDVIMPDLNGQELSRMLLLQRPDLKVIFMSGYTADIIAKHGVLEPGIHYLEKPFRFDVLARTLRCVLEEG